MRDYREYQVCLFPTSDAMLNSVLELIVLLFYTCVSDAVLFCFIYFRLQVVSDEDKNGLLDFISSIQGKLIN